jgi:hypothetical protein
VIPKLTFLLLGLQVIAGCAEVSVDPESTVIPNTTHTVAPDTSLETNVVEPPIPYGGGVTSEIPKIDGPEEVDCVDAESLCEEGVFACDDLADYCDVGPDGLEELPDEYDWDGG